MSFLDVFYSAMPRRRTQVQQEDQEEHSNADIELVSIKLNEFIPDWHKYSDGLQ